MRFFVWIWTKITRSIAMIIVVGLFTLLMVAAAGVLVYNVWVYNAWAYAPWIRIGSLICLVVPPLFLLVSWFSWRWYTAATDRCAYCPNSAPRLVSCPSCYGDWEATKCSVCAMGKLCPRHGQYYF